jgi:hypothetical protein
MCFVNILNSASCEVFVLVGANLLLYKSHRGISSKSPNPSQVLIVNDREPTNAILKTHPFMKTPFVPFIIQS